MIEKKWVLWVSLILFLLFSIDLIFETIVEMNGIGERLENSPGEVFGSAMFVVVLSIFAIYVPIRLILEKLKKKKV